MISLKMRRPMVDSITPVLTTPFGRVFVTLTFTLEWRVASWFSYARIASFTLLKTIPSPFAPGRS